jgi:diguanylate cyclase (GGDEF)-like protein
MWRFASIGLIVTLLSLAGLSLTGVAQIRTSADTVARSRALADAYARANRAVWQEQILEQQYRLARSDEIRTLHAAAGADLNSALTDVQRMGDSTDHALVLRLRDMLDAYGYAVLQVFASVDLGQDTQAAGFDSDDVEPVFTEISTLVQGATDNHASTADRAITQMRKTEAFVFVMIVAGFGLCLVLASGFTLVIGRYQRQLLRQAEQNEHAALHDALTGLPNRTLFADRLGQTLAAGRRSGSPAAVVLLDLDRFKEVNDTLGHEYGDELLRAVAARLREVLRTADTVARLSGDEFALLLPDADAAVAADLAGRILRRLHSSFVLQSGENRVTVDVEASVGVAMAPVHGDTVEELMRCADVAMYTAKDAKNGAVMYEPATAARQPNRLLLLGDLRRALEQPDELVLYYQPKVNLPMGELCGVEALVRWEHPTRGLVSPNEFIPVAENTGLVNLLTTHVLRLAVRQGAAWRSSGLRVPIAVNLSARCLVDPSLLDRVRALLEEHHLPPELLRLEVTESAVMANPALAQKTLVGLHQLGVRLSIDDYGTGYSSMAYLKRLPVDELKIDRSFVLNMTDVDNDDAILVRSAIDLGHNLGLTVVAEGVERAEHVSALIRLGCDIAQGYHFARPMPAPQLLTWLRERRTSILVT